MRCLKIVITSLLLLVAACTSQREQEAEHLFMEAVTLETKGGNQNWLDACDLYQKVAVDYRDTRYRERALSRLDQMSPHIAERIQARVVEQSLPVGVTLPAR